MGRDGDERGQASDDEADEHQEAIFREEHARERGAAKAKGAQNRQFAAPFNDISQQDDAQAERAQEQAQAAQGLKRGKIGVFNGLKMGEFLRGWRGVQADVFKRFSRSAVSSTGVAFR